MPNSNQVRVAVIAAAGHATRMWPASKVVPKELFPLGRTPAIAHIVSEFAQAGIRRIVLVVSEHSGSLIRGLFDKSRHAPAKVAKDPSVQEFVALLEEVEVTTILQSDRYGNAIPLVDAAAREVPEIQSEPCIYAFGDDVVIGENVAEGLIRTYHRTGCAVLAAQEVAPAQKCAFGILETYCEEGVHFVSQLIEKPKPEDTESNLASFGRYLVTPDLMEVLRATPKGRDDEVWFVDGVNRHMKTKRVCALPLTAGNWYTVGDPKSYAEAVRAAALALTSGQPKILRTSDLSPAT